MARPLAVIIALSQITYFYFTEGAESALLVFGIMVPPLFYIWFSDEVGVQTANHLLHPYARILRPSPGWLVKIIAFLGLCLPTIIKLLVPYVILPLFAPDVLKSYR